MMTIPTATWRERRPEFGLNRISIYIVDMAEICFWYDSRRLIAICNNNGPSKKSEQAKVKIGVIETFLKLLFFFF